jgi:hypothetical protein
MYRSKILLLTLILWLGGCASGIQNTRISANKPLPVNHGVVAVQVVNNAERLGTLHKGWSEVIAVRLDNQKAIREQAIATAKEKALQKRKTFNEDDVEWEPDYFSLTSFDEGVIDSQVFIGSMPAGKYIIASLYSFYSDGNMSSWVSMPVFYSAGTFTVTDKQLTSLGTVVFQPLLSIKEASFWNNQSSQKAFVTRLDEQKNIADYVLSQYPKIKAQLDLSTVNTWQQDELDGFRLQLGDLARKNAYSSHDTAINATGDAAMVARFGQLRVRDSKNQWKQVNLPTNVQLSAVLEKNKKLYVGGERGQLFVDDIKTLKNWQPIEAVDAKEAIVWLGESKQSIFALTKSKLQYTVYKIDTIEEPWQSIGRFKHKGKSVWIVNGGLFPIITTEGNLRIINDNKIFDYDDANNTWSNKKGTALAKLTQNSQGVLLALEVSQWDGVGDQLVSTNNGDSWQTVKRSLQVFGDKKTEHSLVAVLNNNVLVSVGRIKTNKKLGELHIISKPLNELNDKTPWQVGGLADKSCQQILSQLSSLNKVYFLCDQGKIISTADFGLTWHTEIEIDIAKMQAQYELLIEAMKKQVNAKPAL